MDFVEVPPIVQVFPEPPSYLFVHLVAVSPILFGPALGEVGHCRLGRVPIASTILVQVGSGASETPHRVTEDSGGLSWNNASKLDTPVFDSLVRRSRDGGGAKVDRAGHPATGAVLAKVGHLAVQPQGKRVRAVYITLYDGDPVVWKVSRELELHAWIVQRHVGRQNQGIAVALLPRGCGSPPP